MPRYRDKLRPATAAGEAPTRAPPDMPPRATGTFPTAAHGLAKWNFPGFRDYYEASAAAVGLDSPRHANMTMESWHARQIQTLLGQYPGVAAKASVGDAAADSASKILDEVRGLYFSVIALGIAMFGAISETVAATGGEPPAWINGPQSPAPAMGLMPDRDLPPPRPQPDPGPLPGDPPIVHPPLGNAGSGGAPPELDDESPPSDAVPEGGRVEPGPPTEDKRASRRKAK